MSREIWPCVGEPYVLVLGVDISVWERKYGLKPYWGECADCGAKLYVDQPYVSQTSRGFVAKPCKCGSDSTPFSFLLTHDLERIK